MGRARNVHTLVYRFANCGPKAADAPFATLGCSRTSLPEHRTFLTRSRVGGYITAPPEIESTLHTMLTLRPDQFEAFEEHMFRALQTRVEQAIAVAFPELGTETGAPGETAAEHPPSGRISGIAERGIESAVAHEVQEPADIAAFIALGLALRLSPPKGPTDWIKNWLERPDTSGATKLAIIETQLAEEARNDPAWMAIAERVAKARQQARP